MILHAQGVVHATREFTSNPENAELYRAPSIKARKVIATTMTKLIIRAY